MYLAQDFLAFLFVACDLRLGAKKTCGSCLLFRVQFGELEAVVPKLETQLVNTLESRYCTLEPLLRFEIAKIFRKEIRRS